MTKIITYGEGGHNPKLPNNNIVEILEIEDPPIDEVMVARDIAISKLEKLGITQEDLSALLG